MARTFDVKFGGDCDPVRDEKTGVEVRTRAFGRLVVTCAQDPAQGEQAVADVARQQAMTTLKELLPMARVDIRSLFGDVSPLAQALATRINQGSEPHGIHVDVPELSVLVPPEDQERVVRAHAALAAAPPPAPQPAPPANVQESIKTMVLPEGALPPNLQGQAAAPPANLQPPPANLPPPPTSVPAQPASLQQPVSPQQPVSQQAPANLPRQPASPPSQPTSAPAQRGGWGNIDAGIERPPGFTPLGAGPSMLSLNQPAPAASPAQGATPAAPVAGGKQFCDGCGQRLGPNARFCPGCGARVQP